MNILIRTLFVCCFAAAVICWSPVVEGALVSHYTFDDAGDLGADSAGTNPGTPVDGASQGPGVTYWGPGSLSLDGDLDMMTVGGNASFEAVDDDGDGWTLAAWVKTTGNGDVQRIFSTDMAAGWAGGGWGAGFRQDLGSDQFISTTYGVVDMNHDVTGVLDGNWHHVAYVFRNNAGSIATDYYVGGIPVGSQTPANGFGINSTGADYVIGALNLASVPAFQYFNGLIDDLRIYDTELTEGQIRVLAVPEPACTTLLLLTVLAGLCGGWRSFIR